MIDMQEATKREIEDLHVGFEDWFCGRCENSDAAFQQRFLSRLDDDLELILPGGTKHRMNEFFQHMRGAHGCNPEFAIQIRHMTARAAGDLVVANYEEWQKSARNSEPSNNGRISTALLQRDATAPHGLRWLHLHETWLPDNVVAADPFDF